MNRKLSAEGPASVIDEIDKRMLRRILIIAASQLTDAQHFRFTIRSKFAVSVVLTDVSARVSLAVRYRSDLHIRTHIPI